MMEATKKSLKSLLQCVLLGLSDEEPSGCVKALGGGDDRTCCDCIQVNKEFPKLGFYILKTSQIEK